MELTQSDAWERAKELGIRSLTSHELLAIMASRNETDVEMIQLRLTKELSFRTLGELAGLGNDELHRIGGLDVFESHRILCAMELGRRIGLAASGEKKPEILNKEDAYHIFQDLARLEQEHFYAAFLNSKGHLIFRKLLHIGTLNSSIVGPRELFREAVRANAASIIVAHNHPSGDPEPSQEDIALTRTLVTCGKMLDIIVHDHIIIGASDRWVSLAERGLI